MNEAIQGSKLRTAVEYFYDLQKLRIASGNRNTAGVKTTELDDRDKEFLAAMSVGLNTLEKEALKHVRGRLKGIPIYEQWLKDQKGVGPTMAGVMLSQIDITRCNTPSQLWAYCGFATVRYCKDCEKVVEEKSLGESICSCGSTEHYHRADRRKKGEKTRYNPWLKAKLAKVLAESFIKSNSPWRKFYDDYKHRKQNELVDGCMACEGKGKVKGAICINCKGKGGPSPWGRSDGHRHNAAKRYMVKMFLMEMWVTWRSMEGLETRTPYAEEYLNRAHHADVPAEKLSKTREWRARRDYRTEKILDVPKKKKS